MEQFYLFFLHRARCNECKEYIFLTFVNKFLVKKINRTKIIKLA